MGNIVIILILSITILLALRPTIRHFKGKGGCCGDCCRCYRHKEEK